MVWFDDLELNMTIDDSQLLEISIQNVNEAPSEIHLAGDAVAEENAEGNSCWNPFRVDPDNNDQLSFALQGVRVIQGLFT